MSDFSHMCKKNKFIQLYLKNSKRFSSSQYLFNKMSYDKKQMKFQCYLHFTEQDKKSQSRYDLFQE